MRVVKSKYTIVTASRTGRYLEMFKNLDKQGVVQDFTADQSLLDSCKVVVKWASDVLKREDRVMWFLRQFKKYLLETKSRKKTESQTVHLRRELAHFVSNAETNNFTDVLNFKFPSDISHEDLIAKLRHFEQTSVEKKKEEKRLLEKEEGVKTFVKFPDGWEWQLLPAGSCSKEGASMRHCGNVPSVKPGDEILSLREPVKKGKETLWKPHATFILNEGRLGEMKGFANEKPDKKLHPYIKELLLQDDIEGIKGGGYEAKKNFALSDLTDEDRADLYEKKPELDLVTYYRNNKEKVLKECGAKGTRPNGSIIIDEWKNLIEFGKELSPDLVSDIERLDEHDLIHVDYGSFGDSERWDILDFFSKKNPGAFKEFAKKVSADLEDAEALVDAIEKSNVKGMLSAISEQLEDGNLDDLKGDLNSAVASGCESGAQSALYKHIQKEMTHPTFEEHDDVLDVNWDDAEHLFDATIYVTISEKDFLKAYASGEMTEEDNDLNSYYFSSVRNSFLYSGPNDLNDYDEESAWESFMSNNSY